MAIQIGGMFKKEAIQKPERKVTSFSDLTSNRVSEQSDPVDVRSIIKVSGQVKEPVRRQTTAVSFTELMAQRDLEMKAREQEAIRQQLEEEKRIEAAERVAKKPYVSDASDSGIIKPKYLEDKSVFYKNSGYLQDLLGEGN